VEDYAWATRQIVRAAAECGSCGGRVVSVLEGGYDLEEDTSGLPQAVQAHVRELMQPVPVPVPVPVTVTVTAPPPPSHLHLHQHQHQRQHQQPGVKNTARKSMGGSGPPPTPLGPPPGL
jgi:hypothetical protein